MRRLSLLLLLPIACQGNSGGCALFGGGHAVQAKEQEPFNLGFEVWKLMRSRDPGHADVWDARKDEFIHAVNAVFPPEEIANLPEGVKSLFPLVDDGTLPKMSDAIATMLDKLTPEAQAEMSQGRRILSRDAWIVFLGEFFAQQGVSEFAAVVGQLIAGEQALLTQLFEFLSVQSLGGSDWLLEAKGNSEDPAWVVRVDVHNNPKVAIDAATGQLFAPFIDQDGDGAADVNADGVPVDPAGQPIEIPAFGEGGALAPVYDYYDAKQTALARLVLTFAELIEAGVHLEIRPVLEAILGPRVLNDEGQEVYGDNPLLDLQWAVSQTPMGGSVPTTSVFSAFQDVGFLQSPEAWRELLDLLEQLQPILDTVLEVGVGGEVSPSTLEHLVLMMQYRDLVANLPVDYSQEAGQNNRSVLEQVIALIASLDGPALPIVGKSIGILVVEGLAKGSGGSLLDVVTTAADLPLVGTLAVPMLNLLGYDGQKVWTNLQVLDSIHTMGGTQGIAGVVQGFVDEGKTQTVLDLFTVLDQNPDVLRRAEPALIVVLEGESVSGGGFEILVDDDEPVLRKDGTPVPSRLHLFLEALRGVIDRVEAAGVFYLFDHLTKTSLNLLVAQGLGGTPSFEGDFLTSRALPIFIDLWKAIELSPQREGFFATLKGFAEPALFGPTMRLVVQGLERKTQPTPNLTAWLSEVLDPDHPWIGDVLSGLGATAQTGFAKTLIQTLRNLFTKVAGKAPIETFLEIFDEVGGGNPMSAADIIPFLKETLPQIYGLIQERKK